MNELNAPSMNKTIFGIVVFALGVIISSISSLTAWQAASWELGWILVAIGIPLILGGLYISLAKLNILRLILLIKKEKLLEINRDQIRGKELITKIMLEWAQCKDACTLKISGVAMIVIFGNNGILKELIDGKKIINPNKKCIQVLLLNPYATNAITKSIKQNRPFNVIDDPMSAITEHTLDRHKECVLYSEFVRTARNITNLLNNQSKFQIRIECKIYSSTPPNFLLIHDRYAFVESLVHVKKRDELKLTGLLPHLVYGDGEIRDGFEGYFDYVWKYDSIDIEDFHERVEEKYYEINRLFLLYSLQKELWDKQWADEHARSHGSVFDALYKGYLDFFPEFSPTAILDLGCGDGGGGSLTMLKEHPNAKIDFVDISEKAIELLKTNMKNEGCESRNAVCTTSDMLTFLIRCESHQYSLVYANFSIIYMTKIKTIETYRRIFDVLQPGGIFMLSLWTINYFKMPIAQHGEEGKRPPHEFAPVPMTEDLRILTSKKRQGEIRRFYRNFQELLEEFQSADHKNVMDLDNLKNREYEKGAILRVWVQRRA